MLKTPVSCGSGPDPELYGHLYEMVRPERCPADEGRAQVVKNTASLRKIWRVSSLLFLQNSRSATVR